MNDRADRISKLTPKQLLLLAVEQQERLEALQRRQREPIAVIGIGCRFPGGADSPEEFWDLLANGRDGIREVPGDRWSIDPWFDANPDAPGRMSVRTGGFLDSVSDFDATFFGIAPREALSMDPQQRLLLEVAWEALEHAGLAAERLADTSTGVFLGICNQDHFVRLLHRGPDAIDAYLASGNAPSVAAGRLAYTLGLRGPAVAIDTSCSSSLVALHLACRSLRDGETRVVLAGGVNVICSPETSIALSKAHMLAPDGRCKTFDAQADGYARGEGCGVLVLKRQSDAIADGDNILAIIRGAAVNQDGRSGGLTVPNGPAQESVIRAALADAGVAAGEIDYVEAHGTGTALGDPIEARALSRVLCGGRDSANPLLIGSVKTNLGHLESAAGVAGVIKVILSLQRERIPPHLHFREPSPHIAWAEHRLAVTSAAQPWPRGERRRAAGVSSFGFSGTNAHVVLQEAPLADDGKMEPRTVCCLPLSARSETALAKLAARLARALSSNADSSLADVAFTAGSGRSHFSHRLAVVADSRKATIDALTAFAEGRSHPAVHRGIAAPGQSGDVAFLFAGLGSAYPGMGRTLYETSRVFRDAIDHCDRVLGTDTQGRSLNAVLWASSSDDAVPGDPAWARSALLAVEYAAAQTWKSFGIEPAAVIGEADGEFAAALVAGILSLEDGLRLAAGREWPMLSANRVSAADGAEAIQINPPQIPVAWTASSTQTPAFGDPPDVSYWRSRIAEPRRITAGFADLRGAGCRTFLEIGPNPALIPIAERAVPDEGSLFLAPLRAGADSWAGIAHSLAALYVRGTPINWAGVYAGARRIVLPTYPFERRRFWYSPVEIEDLRQQSARNEGPLTGRQLISAAPAAETVSSEQPASPAAVGESDSASPAIDSLYYRVVWERTSLVARGSRWLHIPANLGSAMCQRFVTLAAEHGLSVYDRLIPALDRLCVDYLAAALCQLGFDTTPGRVFAVNEEAARLGVLPRYTRLFTRLLQMMAEDGVIHDNGSTFEIIGALPTADPESRCTAALTEFRHLDSELLMLQRCGTELARVLTGAQDPLQLLFPQGSFAEARKLYIESPWARTYNAALCEALTAAIRELPAKACLRVLEIGAGTGGTTSYVLPMLPADQTEYVFSDLSPLFLERGSKQFADYPFLRTALLDIEKDPFSQGFHPGQFDVVIAANCLHATARLNDTMSHVHSLLAPGGLLLLLEGVAPRRWADLTVGLTEGWWRYTDIALRPDYPLISVAAWQGLLEQRGFVDVAAIPGDRHLAASEAQQAVILARKTAASCAWALVGDCSGLGRALADRLSARGDRVRLLEASATKSAILDGENLVYLGALELASHQAEDAAAVPLCEALACQVPIQWLAQFGRLAEAGRAWLVTCGAQRVQEQVAKGSRWQAPLWGVGHGFSLEQPDRWGGLIDLPPEDSVDALAGTLLDAIEAGDGEDQTAYRDGGRYLRRLIPVPAPDRVAPTLRSDATYLITGGFGGLGLLVARWLAERGARHIALLGRHPDADSDVIRTVEAIGARVICLAGDVADETGMRRLLTQLAEEAPPLRGVVHAATDANATLIAHLRTDTVGAMLRPKIAGTVVLERVTQRSELDFLVLFSSTAALTGAAGLAHYAAASAFLDATAQLENRERRVISINWGAWERIRMASSEVQRSFHQGGLQPMLASVALDALGRLLAGAESQGIVAQIDWARYKPLFEVRRKQPFLSRVGVPASPAAVATSSISSPAVLRNQTLLLAHAPVAARPTEIRDFVRRELAAVLGADLDDIASDQDLFAMGMDSLMSIELKRRLEAGLGQTFPASLIFTYPTVEALALFLTSAAEANTPDLPAEATVAESLGGTYPLSYSQKALWFLHQQDPQSTAYHVSLSVRVLSNLDITSLRCALQTISDRHAVLRTTYAVVDGAPCQQVAEHRDVAFELHAARDLSDAVLRNLLEGDARRPFDLQQGPVMRASVYTRGPEDHALLLSIHHIAIDGWSILMIIDELLTLYAEMTEGRSPAWVAPKREYSDFACWQEAMLDGVEGDRLWSYWQQQLAAPRQRMELPADHPRPAAKMFDGASLTFRPEGETVLQVMDLARIERTTPFVVLLAAFQVFLSKLTGAEDVIVGTSAFTRSNPQFIHVAGNFVNSVPIRGAPKSTTTFRGFVRQLASTVVAAIDAQEFPLPLLVQRLQPERSASSSPLFDTFFSLLRFPQFKAFSLLYGSESDAVTEVGGLRLLPFPIEQGAGQFDLSLQMVEIAGSLRAAFTYRTGLFNESTIRRYADDFLTLVDALTGEPDMLLGTAPGPVRIAAVGNEDETSDSDAIVALLDQLGKRDIRLTLDGDRLRINAPRGALDDALKAAIAGQREAVISHLRLSAQKTIAAQAQDNDAPSIRRIARRRGVPASYAQQRIWFLDRIEPGQANYNIGGGLRFRGLLDVECLRRAIHGLIDRHEAFRTRIVEDSGRPWLEILDQSQARIDVIDLSDRSPDAREAECRSLGEALLHRPFDMAHGSLAEFVIIRLATDDHVAIIAMHHVVADGWSLATACHEVCTLYDALAAGRTPNLPPLSIDYIDYAAWEAEQFDAGHFEHHLAYWTQHLQGAPAVLELPTDRARPPIPSHRGGRLQRYFDGKLIAALETYGRRHGATLFMTLLAAWQILMHRYSGQDDIVVGTPIANRDVPALEGLIGCLVNNIPLRSRLDGNPDFPTFLAQVTQTTLNAFDHRALPFDKLVQAINPERSASHAPIFQVMFTLMSFPVRSLAPAGLSADFVDLDPGTSRFDLTVELSPVRIGRHTGQYGVLYDFDSDLFDESTIARLHNHFVKLLVALSTNPSLGIQNIPLLTDEEQQLVADWNATKLPHDRSRCVHHLFEARARSTPGAPAVTAGDETLSYRALDQRANRLAHLLRRRGIGSRALVAVCLDRTIDVPVTLAAVLKVGAAYVPLDPTHPEERLHYILKDAGVSCIVTMSSFLPIFDGVEKPVLLLDKEEQTLMQLSDAPVETSVQAKDLAYVIYTSGSTGHPKGVEVEHRNVVNFLQAMQREPGLTAADTLLAITTLSFDIAGLEIWLPLSVGGRVVIASRTDVLDGARLIAMLEAHEVTILQATPASWRLLLEAGWSGKRDLKALCGGEAMPRDLAAALVDRTRELWNMYGPTETTIWSTVEHVVDASGPITIGHPIANTRLFVLDQAGQFAPIGVVGELHIGGEGVARGYRNRTELTAEKFVTIALPDGTTERVYCTADMARFRADGRVELLGRRDHQVKVRGYRVELGEIEAILNTVAGVRNCVVVVRELAPGDARLIGYVVMGEGTAFDAETARAVLRRKLPEYMVPQLFIVRPALPTTPNGKIDRKALPAPTDVEPRANSRDAILMTPMQRRVADLWCSVLRTERVRLHDNFFDLGGHSLLLVRLHAALKREFATDMPLVELFQHTTVASQAGRLSTLSSANDALVRARSRAERQLNG